MLTPPAKGYRALREGRFSQPSGTYFITFCTHDRAPDLTAPPIAPAIIAELDALQADQIWTLHCGTLMPDHVHLLIELGPILTLGKAVSRLKAKTSPVLRAAGLKWQPGYFDHRLRSHENLLPYFIYTYLNPYRATLLPTDEKWPWFLSSPADRDWFIPMLNDRLPEPAWLANLP